MLIVPTQVSLFRIQVCQPGGRQRSFGGTYTLIWFETKRETLISVFSSMSFGSSINTSNQAFGPLRGVLTRVEQCGELFKPIDLCIVERRQKCATQAGHSPHGHIRPCPPGERRGICSCARVHGGECARL